MVEPSLALTDEPLAASYHLRPAFDLAFAGLIGLPDERFAVRGAQAADWNRAICTNALREALRRYARAPAVSAALDVAAMDAALDRWRTGILLGDEEEVAPANDLPTAFSLASSCSFTPSNSLPLARPGFAPYLGRYGSHPRRSS